MKHGKAENPLKQYRSQAPKRGTENIRHQSVGRYKGSRSGLQRPDEVLVLLEEMTSNTSTQNRSTTTLRRIYSKPDLRTRHRMPALNLSTTLSRPSFAGRKPETAQISASTSQTAVVRQFLTRAVRRNVRDGKKCSQSFVEPRISSEASEGVGTGRMNVSLLLRIEASLRVAELGISNKEKEVVRSVSQRSNLFKVLMEENALLRKYFKEFNELLTDFLARKSIDDYTQQRQAEEYQLRNHVSRLDSLNDVKALSVFQQEFIRLRARVQQLSTPGYLESLQSCCNELDEHITSLRKRNEAAQIKQRVAVYVWMPLTEL